MKKYKIKITPGMTSEEFKEAFMNLGSKKKKSSAHKYALSRLSRSQRKEITEESKGKSLK